MSHAFHHNFPLITCPTLVQPISGEDKTMDGLWELFAATGEPVFYLLYKRNQWDDTQEKTA